MNATEDTLERIRATWALAAGDPDRTARVFYSILFRIDSTAKPLFVGDLQLQGRKLTQTLSFIVDKLDDPDTLVPAAEDLAQRHVSYGVTADQYASVGAALVETFRQLLGARFSPQDETAWLNTYQELSRTMMDAAYPT